MLHADGSMVQKAILVKGVHKVTVKPRDVGWILMMISDW